MVAGRKRPRLSFVIAGAAAGLFMGSVFVSVGLVMLFILAKDTPPGLEGVFGKVPPIVFTMGVVVLGFPTWAVVGVALGLLYRASTSDTVASGLGTPNLWFSASVAVGAVLLAAPPAILLRRVFAGVAVLTLTFTVIFGWLMPFLAS